MLISPAATRFASAFSSVCIRIPRRFESGNELCGLAFPDQVGRRRSVDHDFLSHHPTEQAGRRICRRQGLGEHSRRLPDSCADLRQQRLVGTSTMRSTVWAAELVSECRTPDGLFRQR